MRSAIASFTVAAATLLALPSVPAGAADGVTGQVLPEVVPAGATVSIDVINCPVETTTTIAIDISPQGGAAFLDDAKAADNGGAVFTEKVPIDATPGTYVVRIWCRDEDASEVDTGQLTFQVASLGLQLSPRSGPVGTRLTATGSGCPVGRTEVAFLWFEGASDETPVWDPTHGGVGAPPNEDGTFTVHFTVPTTAVQGENLVSVWCVSEGGSALTGPFMSAFTVTEGSIPPTGLGQDLLFGAGLTVVLGGLLVLFSSRAARH